MKNFPDESIMPRSESGEEPIRGGSIALNRILGLFVEASQVDHRPRFNGMILSAFTIFRNVWRMNKKGTMTQLEDGFVKDVNIFLDYYDTYLSHVWNRLPDQSFCPVLIYFPTYKHLPKELERETKGQQVELFDLYQKFFNNHAHHEGEVRKLERVRCYWMKAGQATYPHKEVARTFKEIASNRHSLYTTGDPVCLITHVPLDLYMAGRLRGLLRLENHTAKVRKPEEFRLRLDEDGRVPFSPSIHVALGDGVLIKAQASQKARKEILETSEKERWISRSEEDIRYKVSKIADIPISKLRSYDFL